MSKSAHELDVLFRPLHPDLRREVLPTYAYPRPTARTRPGISEIASGGPAEGSGPGVLLRHVRLSVLRYHDPVCLLRKPPVPVPLAAAPFTVLASTRSTA